MAISPELKRIYATAPKDDYYVETLELSHSGFSVGSLFITNNPGGWQGLTEDARNITYTYSPFAAIQPRSGEENNLTLQVGLDNASSTLVLELEKIAEKPIEPIIVTYRVYLASDTDTVQNNPPLRLDVLSVTANLLTISFVAGIKNKRQLPFPSMLYTTDLYPGLAR